MEKNREIDCFGWYLNSEKCKTCPEEKDCIECTNFKPLEKEMKKE